MANLKKEQRRQLARELIICKTPRAKIIHELTSKFEITRRTAERDLSDLRESISPQTIAAHELTNLGLACCEAIRTGNPKAEAKFREQADEIFKKYPAWREKPPGHFYFKLHFNFGVFVDPENFKLTGLIMSDDFNPIQLHTAKAFRLRFENVAKQSMIQCPRLMRM